MIEGEAAMAADLAHVASLHASGRYQEARAACLQLLRNTPLSADALLQLGRMEAEAGHLNIAERLLRRALTVEPARAATAHALSKVLVQRSEHQEAMRMLARVLELNPEHPEARLDRGRLHHALGELTEAEADLRAAIARAPDRPHALDALGHLLEEQHRSDEAVSCFERAIRSQPAYAIAHDHLGAVHLARGRIAQAMRCFENALHHDPHLASAHDHLGLALLQQGRAAEALLHLSRAQALSPESAAIAAHQAQAAAALGRCAEAEAGLRAALARAPELVCARAGLAALMCFRGEYQRGLELVEPAVVRSDAPPDLRIVCARLLSRVYRVPDALAVLEPIAGEAARARLSVAQLRALEFILGDLHDLDGRCPEAFACYERGNRLKPSTYDVELAQAQVDRTIATFSAAALARLPRLAQCAPELLLLVGMPCAGTSLVEQILAGHPHVVVAPEPLTLGTIAQRLAARANRAYPGCVTALDAAALDAVMREYRAALPARGVEVQYIVHRVPGDFAHLGLVELLLPRARVVHCARDELDTALSCFAEDSVDPALGYSASLRGIAAFTLAHRRLMAHWRSVLRMPIFELAYEALVADPERESRALMSFLGLPWHPGCLRFHESIRGGAGQGRARRPIYTSSLGRHRRYARELEPLRELLKE